MVVYLRDSQACVDRSLRFEGMNGSKWFDLLDLLDLLDLH
jgi:hypothetical protein